MTDTAAEGPSPEPPPRRRFVLARLADAVRRRDWFTVLVEIAVVVLGVVIGFQVTAWGQGRADQAREQEYLRQFRADLDQTEQVFDDNEAFIRQTEAATVSLLLPYRTGERPPRDSLQAWLSFAIAVDVPYAVVETAEALVETGDLNLIRDDSLRAAITGYLALWERQSAYMESNATIARGFVTDLSRRVDIGRPLDLSFLPDRDSLEAEGWAFPFLKTADPFPLDVEAFYADREAYQALTGLYHRRHLLRFNRDGFRRELVALRERMDRAAPRGPGG